MHNRNLPLVSIGIPTYNRSKLIGYAIRSILSQNYENLEIVISDNASKDETQEVCEAFAQKDPRVRYIRQPQNIGQNPNFRYVRDHAKGKYFMWVSDDDELAPNVLKSYVQFMEANPDYSSVCGQIIYWAEGKVAFCEEGLSMEDLSPRKRVIRYYSTVVQGGLWHGMHRRPVVKQVPVQVLMAGDWHFIAQVAFLGKIKHMYIPGYHKDYEGGVSSDHKKFLRSFGIPLFWAKIPTLRIAYEAFTEITSRSPVYETLTNFGRYSLAIFVVIGILYNRYKTYPRLAIRKIGKIAGLVPKQKPQAPDIDSGIPSPYVTKFNNQILETRSSG